MIVKKNVNLLQFRKFSHLHSTFIDVCCVYYIFIIFQQYKYLIILMLKPCALFDLKRNKNNFYLQLHDGQIHYK